MLRCEAVACHLRHEAGVLDSRSFADAAAKKAELAALKEAGVCRQGAHERMDAVLQCLRHVLHAKYRVDGGGAAGRPTQELLSNWVRELMKSQQRLHTAYARLDQALQRADKRIPLAALASFKRPPAGRRLAGQTAAAAAVSSEAGAAAAAAAAAAA
eukprot:SAG22_NODE_1895_length_3366_cov_3.131007_1_plen_156_part_10